MTTVALLTRVADSCDPKVTTIGMDGRGSREGERVGDSFSDVLIYADFTLEGGVKGAGNDKSGTNSFDTQAPGIPRRLLPSSEAMIQLTRSGKVRAKETAWWWWRVKLGSVERKSGSHEE